MEYRIVHHLVAKTDSDFYPGVDAVLISKTGMVPQWKYGTVEEVPQKEVEVFFERIASNEELQLPEESTGLQPRL